jgi:hypothetical protein
VKPLGVTDAGGDTRAGVLTIHGHHLLPVEGDVVVKLGGEVLEVASATPVEIQALLPVGLLPGRYLLEVLAGPESSWAAPVTVGEVIDGAPPGPVLVSLLRVREAHADLVAGTLLLRGESLGTSPDTTPTVTLSDVPLVVLSATEVEVLAQLPGALEAGTYHVRVVRTAPGGTASVWTDAMDVTTVAGVGKGDITAVNTPAAGGLRGGVTSGDASLGLLPCGLGQVLKSDGASWSCAADVDTNSGGTVQTVSTGAGLTGGPISVTGTVSVATGGITSGMIANGAVGSAQINTAEVQVRISGTCPVGQYFRGINPDGTVVCEPVPGVPSITTVDDPANVVGLYTSIAIGTDGLPVISYHDQTARTLKVAHCGNAACTSGNGITTLDPQPPPPAGRYTSIAIGTDGLPVISYQGNDDELYVTHCGNAACTSDNHTFLIANPGAHTSIAIGSDGFPVISYWDEKVDGLSVAKCSNVFCNGGVTSRVLYDPGCVVLYTSIAIGRDGFPIISYSCDLGYAWVTHCGDRLCSARTTRLVDELVALLGPTSIAIGTDGFPVISYTAKVAKCLDVACSSLGLITLDSNMAQCSMVLGTDGVPLISSLYDLHTLAVTHCGNRQCSALNTITPVDDPVNDVGHYSSTAVGADGLPVISYHDVTAGALKVAKCGTRTCQ